jgi:microcystin-dependent protein
LTQQSVVGGTTYQPPNIYDTVGASLTTIDPQTVSISGAGAGHPNVQPFIVLNYMIATTGIYPSRD